MALGESLSRFVNRSSSHSLCSWLYFLGKAVLVVTQFGQSTWEPSMDNNSKHPLYTVIRFRSIRFSIPATHNARVC